MLTFQTQHSCFTWQWKHWRQNFTGEIQQQPWVTRSPHNRSESALKQPGIRENCGPCTSQAYVCQCSTSLLLFIPASHLLDWVFPCSDNNSLSEVIRVKVSQRLNANTCDLLSDMTPTNRSKHSAPQVKPSAVLVKVSEYKPLKSAGVTLTSHPSPLKCRRCTCPLHSLTRLSSLPVWPHPLLGGELHRGFQDPSDGFQTLSGQTHPKVLTSGLHLSSF